MNLIITLASQLTGEVLESEWDPRWRSFDEGETIRKGLVAQSVYGGVVSLGDITSPGLMEQSEGPQKGERSVGLWQCC